MKNTKEVVVLRFRKVGDLNVTTKHSSRDLLNDEQVFTNILVDEETNPVPFGLNIRFITKDINNSKNNLTLGFISVIDESKNAFGVTSEVDGSITYFKYRLAIGVLKGKELIINTKPSNWDEKL
jgi:AAA15 family ATPase/GTPase